MTIARFTGAGRSPTGRSGSRAARALLGALVLAFVAGQAVGAAHSHPRASAQVSAVCGVCLLAAQVADQSGEPPALVRPLSLALALAPDAEAPYVQAVLPPRVSRAPPVPARPLKIG